MTKEQVRKYISEKLNHSIDDIEVLGYRDGLFGVSVKNMAVYNEEKLPTMKAIYEKDSWILLGLIGV